MPPALKWKRTTFLPKLERRSKTKVRACLQCHKCSSGCPVSEVTDLVPSQVMRLAQLGAEGELLGSRAIWLCASCAACTTRCPMSLDVAAVMDTLRMMAVEQDASLGTERDARFGDAFLGSVQRHGRVYELGMLLSYKLGTQSLFEDLDKGRHLFFKGKLRLLPNKSGSVADVREVFARADEEERRR